MISEKESAYTQDDAQNSPSFSNAWPQTWTPAAWLPISVPLFNQQGCNEYLQYCNPAPNFTITSSHSCSNVGYCLIYEVLRHCVDRSPVSADGCASSSRKQSYQPTWPLSRALLLSLRPVITV